MEIPKHIQELKGTNQLFSGYLFSRAEKIEDTEFEVLDCRWGSAQIMDMKTMKAKHPTVEFLVKRDGMRASRWTKPFAVRTIVLEEEEV